ncbi:hypothetical protein LIA77_09424 [Sarocladium implicatum]|nr:hypothetical protein LIA77_09424 [Sarocladium implicatum]
MLSSTGAANTTSMREVEYTASLLEWELHLVSLSFPVLDLFADQNEQRTGVLFGVKWCLRCASGGPTRDVAVAGTGCAGSALATKKERSILREAFGLIPHGCIVNRIPCFGC